MRRGSRWPWIFVSLLLGLVACGPIETNYYDEQFETVCDGAPCGWARTSGEPEQAHWISTIHPAIHGIRLSGDVSIRGPGGMGPSGHDPASLYARMTARCDEGNQLRIDVLFSDSNGVTYTATVRTAPAQSWGATDDLRFDLGTPTSNLGPDAGHPREHHQDGYRHLRRRRLGAGK